MRKKEEKLIKLATYLSVSVVFMILLIKLYAWVFTKSVSVLASLVDSTMDITASVINLFAVRFATQPADNNHRFGHNKIQDLAVFGQSIFFFASSLFIIFVSITKFSKDNVQHNEIGVWAMIISIILTSILVLFQTYVIKKTKSTIIIADKLHYVTDIFGNIAVILSLYLSYKFIYIDSIFGILIGLYLINGSYSIFRESLRNLLDEELPELEKSELLSILADLKEKKIFLGVHDIKTRKASEKYFIQFHIELPQNMNLYDAHNVTDNVTFKIKEKFPYSEIIIHVDPHGHNEPVEYKDKLL